MVLDANNFIEFISKDEVVLVDFFATWCGPCRMLAPILEEINETGTASVGNVDVDTEEAISMAYGIQNIPTLIAFKNGKILGKKVGFMPKEKIVEWINSLK
jgi:thioredoxin 1